MGVAARCTVVLFLIFGFFFQDASGGVSRVWLSVAGRCTSNSLVFWQVSLWKRLLVNCCILLEMAWPTRGCFCACKSQHAHPSFCCVGFWASCKRACHDAEKRIQEFWPSQGS